LNEIEETFQRGKNDMAKISSLADSSFKLWSNLKILLEI